MEIKNLSIKNLWGKSSLFRSYFLKLFFILSLFHVLIWVSYYLYGMVKSYLHDSSANYWEMPLTGVLQWVVWYYLFQVAYYMLYAFLLAGIFNYLESMKKFEAIKRLRIEYLICFFLGLLDFFRLFKYCQSHICFI